MSSALPVLGEAEEEVRCEPYRAKLRKGTCAQRWTIANGSKEDWLAADAGGSASAGLAAIRASRCRGCGVGEQRAAELKSSMMVSGRFKRQKEGVVIKLEKRTCSNPECGKLYWPKRQNSTCCSPKCQARWGFLKKKGLVPTRAAAQTSPLTSNREKFLEECGKVYASSKPLFAQWVALQSVIDERIRISEESIAAARQDLKAFEEAHPEVLGEVRSKLARWTGYDLKTLTAPPDRVFHVSTPGLPLTPPPNPDRAAPRRRRGGVAA